MVSSHEAVLSSSISIRSNKSMSSALSEEKIGIPRSRSRSDSKGLKDETASGFEQQSKDVQNETYLIQKAQRVQEEIRADAAKFELLKTKLKGLLEVRKGLIEQGLETGEWDIKIKELEVRILEM